MAIKIHQIALKYPNGLKIYSKFQFPGLKNKQKLGIGIFCKKIYHLATLEPLTAEKNSGGKIQMKTNRSE
jgi:hypothetical protein